jgi:hypothetical protein
MTEDERLRSFSLADRLRIAAVDLAITGAPRALVAAVWEASRRIDLLLQLAAAGLRQGTAEALGEG